MIVTELIKTQVFETSVMLGAGLGLGILCSLFFYIKNALLARERKREEAARGHFVFGALEIAFWVLAALFITRFLGYASHGALSFHNFLAVALGALLWRKLFYGKIKS